MSHIQSTTSTTQTTSEVAGLQPEKEEAILEQPTHQEYCHFVEKLLQVHKVSLATSKKDKVALLVAGAAEVGNESEKARCSLIHSKVRLTLQEKYAFAKGHGSDVGKF